MTDVEFGILPWNQAASRDEMLDAARRDDRLYAISSDPYQDLRDDWSLLAAWARETELSAGGAWFALEHKAHGIDFGSVFGQRLDSLDESVAAMRALLGRTAAATG